MAYNISNKKFKIYIDPEKNYINSINKSKVKNRKNYHYKIKT